MRFGSFVQSGPWVIALSLLLMPLGAGAQPLADRVPEDAILYIGWQGSSTLGAGYDASHTKAMLDASRLPQLFNDFVPRAIARVGQKDRRAAEALNLVSSLGAPLWKYPTAIYFAGIDMSLPDSPVPKVAIICRAGADAVVVEKNLQTLLSKTNNRPGDALPINAFSSGEYVGVSIGYPNEAAVIAGLAADSPKPLAADAGFVNAIKQVSAEPAAVAYLNVEKLGTLVEFIVSAGNNDQAKQMYPVIKEAAGLNGLKRIVCTGGFDGKDWLTQSFIEAPMPRQGLLSFLDVKPVSPELLKVIPDTAAFFATAKLDPARYLTEIRSILGKIDATLPAKFDQGMGAAQMAIGRNLQTDVLEPLGEDWAIYTASDVAGGGFMGMVVVNKLDDPKKAASGLPAFWNFLSSALTMAAKQGNKEMVLQGQSTKIDDLTVYYLGTPLVSPAWAIKDGYLYISLYPQNVASAAARTGVGKSIVDTEAYQSLQKRLGVDKAISVSFTDLPKTAGASYQSLLMLFRVAGVGDLFGVKVPEPLLPPLSTILPHLAPAGGASWVDDAGWHHKSVSPFPGSELLGETGGVSALAVPALGASILLPSLNRARETANRVKCASNLRQIGQACLLYSNEHKGKYPNSIAEIVAAEDIVPEVFMCPSAEGPRARPALIDPVARGQWAQDHTDYVYVGQGLKNDAPADTVVCYEKLSDHNNDGVNVLFGDGHVEFVQREQAKLLIPDLSGGL